jgi:hypothetical protein
MVVCSESYEALGDKGKGDKSEKGPSRQSFSNEIKEPPSGWSAKLTLDDIETLQAGFEDASCCYGVPQVQWVWLGRASV